MSTAKGIECHGNYPASAEAGVDPTMTTDHRSFR
jgi:hypothetical protein